MTNLQTRTITGAVYVLSVILAIFLHPLVCFFYFFAVSMIGLWEFYHNSEKKDIHPNKYIGFALAIITYLSFGFTISSNIFILLSLGLLLSLIILLFVAMLVMELYRKESSPFTNISYTLLGIVYVVVPLALTNIIIQINDYQPMILMSVFIFAWCNDTFAYLVGRKFGKHKLFERISPKKTWEGSIGGFLSVIIAAIVVACFSKAIAWYDYVAIAIITSIVGTFGDLVESMFKRQMGVKDSGNILPGHGGILDRFDILLLALPVVTAYLLIIFLY